MSVAPPKSIVTVTRIHPEFRPKHKSRRKRGPRVEVLRRAVLQTTAVIQPFQYQDAETGNTIGVSVSPYYAKITVNDREYYFTRETGKFDGVAIIKHKGPILIYDGE